MIGHALNLHSLINPQGESIRLTFRRVAEDIPLWPTGVGDGEFISQATLEIGGLTAQRVLMVCPTGEITEIRYHDGDAQPAVIRGDLEFGLILSTPRHCEPGFTLVGETQHTAETIISSLKVPSQACYTAMVELEGTKC